VPNWKRLATDPEIREMWQSDQIRGLRNQLQQILTNFKLSGLAGGERRAYHQGMLEGLKIIEQLPEKMLEIELKTHENQEVENAANLRRFPGLRFGGM
jgi:hypothetical protein